MGDQTERPDDEESVGQILSTVGDAVGDMITGIPAPIRKNAIKAFGRLCTAAVEYPVTLLEDAIEEHHAASRARVKLIETEAGQIAEQMRTDPAYARAAVAKFGRKILRERVNIDQISDVAAEELKSERSSSASDKATEAPPISEDWLNAFEDEAARMSSEQMQLLFGRILAGEIRKPSSFSIKTIKVMAQLDNRAATLFQTLCSLAVSLRAVNTDGDFLVDDFRVVSMGNAASNSLRAYGLAFDELNVLQEYGLIISDYNSYMGYSASIIRHDRVTLPFSYQSQPWAFIPQDIKKDFGEFHVNGVALSRSGRELAPVVDTKPNEAYTTALKKFFENQGVAMTPVQIR